MFTSVLCPVDFSEVSERALGYAVRLAALGGARFTVLHVVEQLLESAAEASGNREALMAQMRRDLEKLLERLGAVGVSTEIAIEVGDSAPEILKRVEACQADLIVMGTQGRQGASRLMFGSTTEAVLRRSTVPVLAVPPVLS